jgi:hypothetical protein
MEIEVREQNEFSIDYGIGNDKPFVPSGGSSLSILSIRRDTEKGMMIPGLISSDSKLGPCKGRRL